MKAFCHRIETNDFDDFVEAERSIGVSTDKMQLSSGSGHYGADYVQVGDITLWRYRSDHKIRHEYILPGDLVELSISIYPTPFVWCGMEVPGSSAAIHQGGRVYECVTPPGGAAYGFVFLKSQIRHWGFVDQEQLDRMVVPESAVAMGADPFQDRFLRNIDHMIDRDISSSSPDEVVAAHETLVVGCQQILDKRFRAPVRPTAAPSIALISRAREMIVDRLEDQLTAGEIAIDLGVSRRSLELGFQRALGMSPYQFLLVQRLHTARQHLKQDACTILEACCRSGFTNTGRFARMYSRHFGELPSSTRRLRGSKEAGSQRPLRRWDKDVR